MSYCSTSSCGLITRRALRHCVRLSVGIFSAAAGLLATAPTAQAAANTHDGFYFEGTLGATYLVSNSTVRDTDFKISGVGPSTSFLFGGTLAEGLVLGGGYTYSSALSPTLQIGSQSRDSDADTHLYLSTIGPFIDYFPSAHDGFHVQALVGLGLLSLATESTSSDAGRGFALGIGAGYEFWIAPEWSIGVLGRFSYASINDRDTDDVTWATLAPALLVSFTYH